MISADQEPNVVQLEKQLMNLSRSMHILTKRILRQLGLSLSRFFVLLHLSKNEMSMGALRNAIHLSRSTLTSLVDGLTEESMVQRRRGQEDRRMVQVKITDKGREAVTEVLKRRRELVAEATEDMPKKEIDCFMQHLEEINDHLKEAYRHSGRHKDSADQS